MPAAHRPLSPAADRVLVAAVAAIRPCGHGFDQPIDDDVLKRVRGFFPFLPPPLRRAFPLGLRALEWMPLLVLRRRRRFSTLPVEDARRVLERLNDRGGPFGALVLGLRTLVFLALCGLASTRSTSSSPASLLSRLRSQPASAPPDVRAASS